MGGLRTAGEKILYICSLVLHPYASALLLFVARLLIQEL